MAPKHIIRLNILKTILLHLLFWVVIVTYFAWGFDLDVHPKASFIIALYFLPGHMIMVYILRYFLVPKYLLQRKFWQFLLGFPILELIYAILGQLSLNSIGKLQGVTQ